LPLPSRLYYFKNQSGNAIAHNDYNYDSDTFGFRTNTDGSKLRSHLKYFADQGFISKDLSAGEQLDTCTHFPYKPIVRLGARHGYPTGTALTVENGFDPHGEEKSVPQLFFCF
jgi:hypothetical protein